MKHFKSNDNYIIRIDRGEEVISSLIKLCEEEKIMLGEVSAIGACDYVKVGLYDVEQKVYKSKKLVGQMEITSLIGNISTKDGEVYLHLHINVCDNEMRVFGGHLNECRISATCEMIVKTIDGKVNRKLDGSIGLNLFDL